MLNPPSLPRPFRVNRVSCSFRLERESGFQVIAGVDEVGRGCLAGPVVVASVSFSYDQWAKSDSFLTGITDSKKLSAKKREEFFKVITNEAKAYSIQSLNARQVDELNILRASLLGAQYAVEQLQIKLDHSLEFVLMDGPYPIPQITVKQRPVISGDQISKSIAAASIIAKITRDRLMDQQAEEFPEYGFEKNKGYGTSQHLAALEKFGPTRIHRLSFLKKIENLQMGKLAEERAQDFLKAEGFSIVECNWRNRIGEIDVIGEKEKKLHFFEVRYRKSAEDIDFAFPSSKQEQVKKMVSLYVARIDQEKYQSIHASLIFVTPQKIEPYWDVFKF